MGDAFVPFFSNICVLRLSLTHLRASGPGPTGLHRLDAPRGENFEHDDGGLGALGKSRDPPWGKGLSGLAMVVRTGYREGQAPHLVQMESQLDFF